MSLSRFFYFLGCVIIFVLFGRWFAIEQINHVAPAVANSYPTLFYYCTILKVGLFVFVLLAAWQQLINGICQQSFDSLSLFYLALPLLVVYLSISLAVITIIMLCISFMQCVMRYKIIKQSAYSHRFDLFSLIISALWVAFFKPLSLFSPLQLSNALLNFPLEEIPVISPLYKSYIWAKQYSFSMVDYAHFGAIMHTAAEFASPVMQLLALILNYPSIDVMGFHQLLLVIVYVLAVAGSFGFYLYLRYSLTITPWIALVGSLLFIYGNFAISPTVQMDSILFLTSYLLLPYPLLLFSSALKHGSYHRAALTGLMLALPFFILNTHPEMTIYAGLLFGVVAGWQAIFGNNGCSRLRAIGLLVICLIAYVLIILYRIGPLIWDIKTGYMSVMGHSVSLLALANVKRPSLFLLAIVIPILAIDAWRQRSVKLGAWLMIAFLIYGLFIFKSITTFIPSLAFLSTFNIHLNLPSFWRLQLLYNLALLVLAVYAINCLYEWNKIPGITAAILLLLYPAAFHGRHDIPLTTHATIANPQHCRYQISLQSLLVNYSGLQYDAANLDFIKSQLLTYQTDSHRDLLIQKSSSKEEVLSIAHRAYKQIDQFYLENNANCLYPFLTKKHGLPEEVLLYNVDAYYTNLPNPYLRILGATGNDDHLGIGPGLLIHNASTTYDNRFVASSPLLNALYMIPQYDFDNIGEYKGKLAWVFEGNEVLDPVTQHLFSIAGMDIYAFNQPVAISDYPYLKQIAFDVPQAISMHLFPYYNKQSYGVAYLASKLIYDNETTVRQQEAIIQRYFHQKASLAEFRQARDYFLQKLSQLKTHQAVIVESKQLMQTIQQSKAPSGQASILGMIGERIALRTQCQKTTCLLVLNMAYLHGWKVYVNNRALPTYRINYAFIGVPVPQGVNDIWFIYQPLSSLLFYLLSLGSLLAILLCPPFGGIKKLAKSPNMKR